jgi:hypothetical protein
MWPNQVLKRLAAKGGEGLARGAARYNFPLVVAVAQLVESQIVILVVVGSSPISHPIK